MTKTDLLNQLNTSITTNGNGAISGASLKDVLLNIINTMFETNGVDYSQTDTQITKSLDVDGRYIYASRAKVISFVTTGATTQFTKRLVFSSTASENNLPSSVKKITSSELCVRTLDSGNYTEYSFPISVKYDSTYYYINDTEISEIVSGNNFIASVTEAWLYISYTTV